jgi:tetratricopeptide (TPR) repeat protein
MPPNGLKSFSVLLLLVLMGWPCGAEARTDRERASTLLRQGNVLHDQGRHAAALKKYRRAHKLFPSYKLHYNFALTLNAMGHEPEAAESLEQFLARATDKTPKAILTKANALRGRLWRKLGVVKVTCSVPGALVKLDGLRRGVTPLSHRIFARPGRHRLTVEKQGHGRYSQTLEMSRGRSASLEVRLDPAGAAAADGWGRRNWVWTAAGVGGGLFLTSVILYAVGDSKGDAAHRNYMAATTTEEFDRTRDGVLEARDMLAAGHVLLGAALAAGGAALYLFLTDGGTESTRVGIAPGPHGGGITVGVPF